MHVHEQIGHAARYYCRRSSRRHSHSSINGQAHATTTATTTSTTQTRRYGSSCLLPSTTQTSRLIAALTAPACMPRWKREHRAAAHACATQNLLQTHYMYVQDYQRTSSSCQLVYMSIAQGSNKDEAATTSVSRRSLLLQLLSLHYESSPARQQFQPELKLRSL